MIQTAIKIISLTSLVIILNLFTPLISKINQGEVFKPVIHNQTKEQNLFLEKKLAQEIKAKSACVFDLKTNKFIFKKNYLEPLALASLTKLMTALVAEQYLSPEMPVRITKEILNQEGDVGLKLGETWNLKNLIKIMLVSSSNDAAYAIAGLKDNFINLMNYSAQRLNLNQTFFLNSTGLDESDYLGGAYGSCKDVAFLMKFLISQKPQLIEATRYPFIVLKGRVFQNTDKLTEKIPMLIAGKTGFSDLAGGNLAFVVDKGLNKPEIIVILGSTEEGRFEDALKIYQSLVK